MQHRERAGSEAEWQEFINCLTTNLTSFFREEHHFHALAEALLPLAGKPIRMWCNAASTGEEPYSVAIWLLENWPMVDAYNIEIVGSDIAHAVPLTLIAGAGHWWIGSVDWQLLASLLVGSIPGIMVGSHFASRVPDRVLRPLLAGTLALVGGKLAL